MEEVMKMENNKFLFFGIVTTLLLISVSICGCNGPSPSPNPTVECSRRGSHSLFIADFEDDTVGSTPAPTTPLHYGPPGASLNIQGDSGTIEVVDSTEIDSKALKLTRGYATDTEVESVVGDIGEMPYTTGSVYIEFWAHGEVIPEHKIASISISVRSSEDNIGLLFRLYEDSYHYWDGTSYVQMIGSYDPTIAHFVHIELDLDANKYSICIDGTAIITNIELLVDDFSNMHLLKFIAPQAITEAFESEYVIDDIRITI
jgi:hypothetical protein